ncbi:efflux RND transporter periplasmic adaptor subunit [bacterium]|nr:efflux RND transporter periplasmic adaptor subunit [bacterium]
MKYISTFFMLAAALSFAVIGCGDHSGHDHGTEETAHDDHGDHGHGHGEGGVVVTLWQDGLELFAEWPPFVTGQSSEGILHFTSMETFKPVTRGSLLIKWAQREDTVKTQVVPAVTRTGIFVADIEPPAVGVYDLIFELNAPDMSGAVVVPFTYVYEDEESAHVPHAEHDGEGIPFLKEQQWMLGTETGLAEQRVLFANVRAPGELKPAGTRMSEVFAPFAGVLMPDHEYGAVRHGQRVRTGQPLAMLSPSPSADNSWYELLGEYRLAKSELERLQKLSDENAVSARRMQEAEQRLSVKLAQLTAALGGAELQDFNDGDPHFAIRSPRDGVIAHHAEAYGSFVEQGSRLFSIVDPSLIWLEVSVAAGDAKNIEDVQNACFTLGSSSELYYTADFESRVIASGSILDPETRRVPITFELKNPEGELKVGEFAQVYVQTAQGKEAVAVPRSAVIDDNGTPVVYVQKGGESFTRRVVSLGIVDGNWVEIPSGVEAEERVVTEGAYKVKLASSATGEVGHGHAH